MCLWGLLAEIAWGVIAQLLGVGASSHPSSWPICLCLSTTALIPNPMDPVCRSLSLICCSLLGGGMRLVGIPLDCGVLWSQWWPPGSVPCRWDTAAAVHPGVIPCQEHCSGCWLL